MNTNRTSLDRTSDREIVITRAFRAPAPLVFDAWTKPEYLRRWWAPTSHGVSVVECDADLRPGGAYRYVIARGESERFAFSGKYVEIVRPTRLVYTQIFEAMPTGEAMVTVTLEERDGATTLIAHERYPSKQVLDGVLASGMERGMRETYEQLEALLATLHG